jgi:hypothetical protein
MAATITTKFYNHDADTFVSPSKIVFTSPNIDDLSPDGTRSHVLPELMEIALWYETTSTMYRKEVSQVVPDNIMFERRATLTSGTFNFASPPGNMVINTPSGTIAEWSPDVVYKIKYASASDTNYFRYDTVTDNGGTWALGAYGTPPISDGTDVITGGTRVYLDPDACDVNFENSIIFEMTLGEAYNAYLTAWDDDTHTTTDNPVISGSHYRAAVVACYVQGGDLTDPYPADWSTYGTLIGTPSASTILYGNVSKYTVSGTLNYNAIDSDVSGAYLAFRPMLYGMDTAGLPFGNYDFITTLHYQYT